MGTPNQNKDMWGLELVDIVDVFWTKFQEFRNRRAVFGNADG